MWEKVWSVEFNTLTGTVQLFISVMKNATQNYGILL